MYFCKLKTAKKGLLTEWLGAGLQNRLLRFESGRDLQGVQERGCGERKKRCGGKKEKMWGKGEKMWGREREKVGPIAQLNRVLDYGSSG